MDLVRTARYTAPEVTSLVGFFSLTFAVSWICWIAAAAVPRAAGEADLPVVAVVLLYAGTVTPSLVALGLTARRGDRGSVTTLLDGVVRGDVDARWYALAIAYLPAVKLAAALVHRVALGAWPPFGDMPWYLFAGAIAISTPVQAGEEIGWRGYALPRLAARLGWGRASLLLGVVWAAWHLPLFYIPGVDNYRQSFTLFLIAVTALSVAMTWLYLRTQGSLLLVMLMHSTVNQTSLLLPSSSPLVQDPFAARASLVGWLTVVLLWIGAAYFLVRLRRIARPAVT
jgi:hypothetical protein